MELAGWGDEGSSDAEAAVVVLKEKIKKYIQIKTANNIFTRFQPEETNLGSLSYKVWLSGKVHCEMGMVAIALYHDQIAICTNEHGSHPIEVCHPSHSPCLSNILNRMHVWHKLSFQSYVVRSVGNL